jgi:5'-nucleotidase
MEGYLFGIPSIAFSQTEKGWGFLDVAGRRARELVQQLIPSLEKIADGAQPTVAPWLLNVNIPNLPEEQLQGFKVCRLGRRHAAERVIMQTSPRGETMYWIGSAGPAKEEGEGTDFHATRHGFVSITPLQVDLTDHERLPYWAQTAARLTQGVPTAPAASPAAAQVAA